MSTISVQGYNPTNKMPGFYARQIFASGSVAGSLFGLVVAVIGATSGQAVPDTQVYPINSSDDVATWAGTNSIGGQMLSGCLLNSGATIEYIAPALANGSVSASQTWAASGTWSSLGTLNYRVFGVSLSTVIQATDTPTTVMANVAAAINGTANLPGSASATSGKLTITVTTPGVSGDQWLSFVDTSLVPSGFVLNTTGSAYQLSHVYPANSFVNPGNGYYYLTTAGGTTNTAAPTWPTTIGASVTDTGGVVWVCFGVVTAGGLFSFGGGAGTPNYTNVIETLSSAQYDIIVPAENDATNLGLLATFVDEQMAPSIQLLNAVVFGTSLLTATQAQALSNTTLNNPAFQQLFAPNSEIHPAVLASSHGAFRSVNETSNPNPRYLNTPIAGSVPQAAKTDWIGNSLGNALLSNGVTPVSTLKGGTQLVVIRGITTYCETTGGSPDTRVLDVNEFAMSKYARMDLNSYWNTDISVNFDECQDDPPPEGPDPAADVLYPSLLTSILTARQTTWMQNGWVVDGSVAQYPTEVEFDPSSRSFFFDLTVVPTPGLYIAAGNIRQRPV